MSRRSQFAGGVPAGSKFPAPWAMADNITTRACNGQKVSASQVSAAVYAGLGYSISQVPHVDATIIAANFPWVTKGGSTILGLQNNQPAAKYTTDGVTWSSSTPSNNARYGLGYDATNALFISCNNAASGNSLETTPTGATFTARSNGAGAGVPATSGRALAISNGGITLCPIVGGTNIGRATNGITYTYQTAPFTISNTTVVAWLTAASLFVLYDYSVSTTTYYTSATGLTGSWTSRTLPFVPENTSTCWFTRAAGKLWIKEPAGIGTATGTCRLAYTTNGTSWTTVQPEYPVSAIAGGYSAFFSSAKQAAHDAGEPYLRVTLMRVTGTNRDTQIQEQLGNYYTTDGLTMLQEPWSMGNFDGFTGTFVDAATGLMPTAALSNYFWNLFTVDASTKSLPLHESHIMKVY